MKSLFLYLLRTKRGILATILCSGAVTLVFCIIYVVSLSTTWDCAEAEMISLLIAAIGFADVCRKAFRVGTANSVSRGTVICTLLLSAFVTAAAVTVLNQGILHFTRYVVLRGQSIETHLLYTRCLLRYIYVYPWWGCTSLSEPAFWDVPLYFGLVLLLLTVTCCLYALHRKYGVIGLAGGGVVLVMLLLFYKALRESGGRTMPVLNSLFYADTPIALNEMDKVYTPKALPFTAAFAVLTAAAAAVFAKCMKHTGIRREHF